MEEGAVNRIGELGEKHSELLKTIENLKIQMGGETQESDIRYIQGRIDEAKALEAWVNRWQQELK